MSGPKNAPADGCQSLQDAIKLVEQMSTNHLICGSTGPFLMPDNSKYLAIDMHPRWNNREQVYHVHFDARVQTTGHPMDAQGLSKLVQETAQTHALLLALEMQDYTLTPVEYGRFCEQAQQQAEQETAPAQGQTM